MDEHPSSVSSDNESPTETHSAGITIDQLTAFIEEFSLMLDKRSKAVEATYQEDHNRGIGFFINTYLPEALPSMQSLTSFQRILSEISVKLDGQTDSIIDRQHLQNEALSGLLWASLGILADAQNEMDNVVRSIAQEADRRGLDDNDTWKEIESYQTTPEGIKLHRTKADSLVEARMFNASVPTLLAGFTLDHRLAQEIMGSLPATQYSPDLSPKERWDLIVLNGRQYSSRESQASATIRRGAELNPEERGRLKALTIRSRFSKQSTVESA